MKKMIVTAAALTMMCGAALAQSGPAPQSDNMSRSGNPTGTMNNNTMGHSATTPGTSSGTTGMSTGAGSDGTNAAGMGKDSTNKDMSRDKRGAAPK
jgi:hypothetical protein